MTVDVGQVSAARNGTYKVQGQRANYSWLRCVGQGSLAAGDRVVVAFANAQESLAFISGLDGEPGSRVLDPKIGEIVAVHDDGTYDVVTAPRSVPASRIPTRDSHAIYAPGEAVIVATEQGQPIILGRSVWEAKADFTDAVEVSRETA